MFTGGGAARAAQQRGRSWTVNAGDPAFFNQMDKLEGKLRSIRNSGKLKVPAGSASPNPGQLLSPGADRLTSKSYTARPAADLLSASDSMLGSGGSHSDGMPELVSFLRSRHTSTMSSIEEDTMVQRSRIFTGNSGSSSSLHEEDRLNFSPSSSARLASRVQSKTSTVGLLLGPSRSVSKSYGQLESLPPEEGRISLSPSSSTRLASRAQSKTSTSELHLGPSRSASKSYEQMESLPVRLPSKIRPEPGFVSSPVRKSSKISVMEPYRVDADAFEEDGYRARSASSPISDDAFFWIQRNSSPHDQRQRSISVDGGGVVQRTASVALRSRLNSSSNSGNDSMNSTLSLQNSPKNSPKSSSPSPDRGTSKGSYSKLSRLPDYLPSSNPWNLIRYHYRSGSRERTSSKSSGSSLQAAPISPRDAFPAGQPFGTHAELLEALEEMRVMDQKQRFLTERNLLLSADLAVAERNVSAQEAAAHLAAAAAQRIEERMPGKMGMLIWEAAAARRKGMAGPPKISKVQKHFGPEEIRRPNCREDIWVPKGRLYEYDEDGMLVLREEYNQSR